MGVPYMGVGWLAMMIQQWQVFFWFGGSARVRAGIDVIGGGFKYLLKQNIFWI